MLFSRFSPGIALSAALLLSLSVTQTVRADQNMTLDLPPSAEAREARAHSQAASANAGRSGQMVRSQGRYHPGRTEAQPSRHQNASERVMGRLGQVDATTPIRRTRSLSAAKLTTASAGTYIAVESEQGEWYGVLMADGSMGWIPRASIHVLDYQVVTSDPAPAQNAPQWGNSDGATPGDIGQADIYPHGDRPYFTADSQSFLNEAYKYLGVPYVWGGNTHNGIDCSGFVKNVYDALGFPLPRLGSDQMAYGVPVPVDQLQAGDRLYFTPRAERLGVHHTGLYVGNGYFIHASSGSHQVKVSHLSESYYRKNFVCARR